MPTFAERASEPARAVGWRRAHCAAALRTGLLTVATLGIGFAGIAQTPTDPGYVLVGELLSDDDATRKNAMDALRRSRDETLLAGLNDVLSLFLRVEDDEAREVSRLMRDIAGGDAPASSTGWIEWIGRNERTDPKPGYLALKGAIFSLYDPVFVELLNPTVPFSIRPEEIEWGGVRKDGIPALDYPRTVEASEATYIRDEDRVFGVVLNGEARAYPHRIMDWHEMANDFVGGVPVTLSYCTLCGSGILFDGRVGDEVVYTFGSSGLLYRSNKLMYDRQSGALWSNLTGEPVSTELIDSGIVLEKLPLVVSTWGEWVARHPETLVLDENTGYDRDYRRSPYEAYFDSDELMFPVWLKDSRLDDKAWVFALVVNGQPKAYPVDAVKKAGVVHDTVRGRDIVLVSEGSVGTIRAYESAGRRFATGEADGQLVESGTGATWTLTEDALSSAAEGVELRRLPGHNAYWFGWFAFYPTTEIFTTN